MLYKTPAYLLGPNLANEVNQKPKFSNIPRSLYFSDKFQPKLADLREALRANSFNHKKYNPKLEDKDFKNYYKAAINKIGQTTEVNEMAEQALIFDQLVPRAQRIDVKYQKERAEELEYEINKYGEKHQEELVDKLVNEKL